MVEDSTVEAFLLEVTLVADTLEEVELIGSIFLSVIINKTIRRIELCFRENKNF